MIQKIKCLFGRHLSSVEEAVYVIDVPFVISLCPACNEIHQFTEVRTGTKYERLSDWLNDQEKFSRIS